MVSVTLIIGCICFIHHNCVYLKTKKHLSAGMVQYAEIKLENGKSKGCGVVRFDNPETAERVCRTMNGFRLNGREIDVRIDRNA